MALPTPAMSAPRPAKRWDRFCLCTNCKGKVRQTKATRLSHMRRVGRFRPDTVEEVCMDHAAADTTATADSPSITAAAAGAAAAATATAPTAVSTSPSLTRLAAAPAPATPTAASSRPAPSSSYPPPPAVPSSSAVSSGGASSSASPAPRRLKSSDVPQGNAPFLGEEGKVLYAKWPKREWRHGALDRVFVDANLKAGEGKTIEHWGDLDLDHKTSVFMKIVDKMREDFVLPDNVEDCDMFREAIMKRLAKDRSEMNNPLSEAQKNKQAMTRRIFSENQSLETEHVERELKSRAERGELKDMTAAELLELSMQLAEGAPRVDPSKVVLRDEQAKRQVKLQALERAREAKRANRDKASQQHQTEHLAASPAAAKRKDDQTRSASLAKRRRMAKLIASLGDASQHQTTMPGSIPSPPGPSEATDEPAAAAAVAASALL